MKTILDFIKNNLFILLLIIILFISSVTLTRSNPIKNITAVSRNDFELIQLSHPEKEYNKVFFGSSVVTASYIEDESKSGFINLGIDYGTVKDLYEMLIQGHISVTDEILLGLNDISFMDELDTNPNYLWHKKPYEHYVYFQRDRLYQIISAVGENLKSCASWNEGFDLYANQERVVYYGQLSVEELKESEQSMLDRFGNLSIDDCQDNFEALENLISYCEKNGIRLRAVWMPWNEKIAIYSAAQNIMDYADTIFEKYSIEAIDMLKDIPSEYFYDIGHLNYDTGAPYFTELLDLYLLA